MKIRPAPPAIAAMAFAFPAIMGNSRFLGFLRDQLDEPLLASLLGVRPAYARPECGLKSVPIRRASATGLKGPVVVMDKGPLQATYHPELLQ